jgi:hypothetical protein
MVRAVSETAGRDPKKKHRHDVGQPDHGAVATEGVTRAIQGVLLLLIAGSAALVVYAVVVAAR